MNDEPFTEPFTPGRVLEQAEYQLMKFACERYGSIELAAKFLGCHKHTIYKRGFKSSNRCGRPRKVK